jgi:hypothetical protein
MGESFHILFKDEFVRSKAHSFFKNGEKIIKFMVILIETQWYIQKAYLKSGLKSTLRIHFEFKFEIKYEFRI